MAAIEVEVTIDTRGLTCPLPVLKVRKMMRGVTPAALVAILATDPGAEEDLKSYCEATGARFVSSESADETGVIRIVIQTR